MERSAIRTRTRRGALAALGALAAGGCAVPGLPFGSRSQPREELAEQQILRLNAGTDPETIDPARLSFTTEIAVVMRLFANLLAYDEKGNLVPDTAEKLPAVSPDGKTLTFTLRPNLKYSDGQPLAAKDFVYGWRRHLDPRTGGEYAFAGHILEGGEALATSRERDPASLEPLRQALGVRARDDRTLEFRLISPAPWFLSVLATWCGVPVREDLVSRPGAQWTDPATAVGNGPFVLRLWERQNRMVFEANPHYHRGVLALKTVEVSMLPEAAVALAAYKNGELDVVGVQREDLASIAADAQLKRQHQQFPGSCTTYLAMNATRPPLDRPAVRRAIAAALDREAYVADVLGGLGQPAGQLVPPSLPGHFPDVRAQKKDLTAARRHLSEAGFSDPKGVPPLRLAYAGGARSRARIDPVVEQLRKSLEVEVVAEPVEARAFSAMTRSAETAPPLFLLGWCQDYPDPQSWYSALFHSGSSHNATGWASPAFDRLVSSADAEPDAKRRGDLYRQAAQLVADEAPVAFLYHNVVSRLVKPWVAGLGENPLEHFEGQATVTRLRILKH